jgi:hypothetical protein
MRFYIFCPSNFATGGPEALHQLCDALLGIGADAAMCYLGEKAGLNPKHPDYDVYRSVKAAKVEDAPDSVVIVPEIFASVFSYFKKAQPCVWWLSVDNYLPHDVDGAPNRVDFTDDRIVHLAQSEYANRFLRERGAKTIIALSDYIREDLRSRSPGLPRRDLILYNPKKGMEFTEKLISAFPDKPFVPLSGMNRTALRVLYETAKVYIDFGHHPGKDRMPREAAAAGCCIITSRSGAAGNNLDTPIDDRYKFELHSSSIDPIGQLIEDILRHYDDRSLDFVRYRDVIENQEAVFRVEAQAFGLHMASRLGCPFPAKAIEPDALAG